MIDAGGEDAAAIAFDGATEIYELRNRMAMLRMVQISNIFRSVFSDNAMPMTGEDPRIRPVYEWHNGNKNNTAQHPLTWADRYFNKTDPASTYSGIPHPVKYFLYGGGGAAYGASNSHGLTDLLTNPFFGVPTVANGYTINPWGELDVYGHGWYCSRRGSWRRYSDPVRRLAGRLPDRRRRDDSQLRCSTESDSQIFMRCRSMRTIG